MYSNTAAFVVLCALVGTVLAVQCNTISSRSTCRTTIDDGGVPCSWCAGASGVCGCQSNLLPCIAVDCSSGDDGGDSSGDKLSGGDIAGLVIGLLIACACCVCIGALVIGAIVATVFFVTRRGSAPTGQSA